MTEEEEGVFGGRMIRPGEGDERLGWEGWLILFGLGVGVVPAAVIFSGMGLDFPTTGRRVWSAPAAPPFDSVRLAAGLGLAVLLVAAAVWLILRTDWVDSE